MPEIRAVPLGAGQEVGRSCILISIGGKNVMLDCGMHMGYNDERRFPDFSYIAENNRLDDYLSCIIITHFHLDHCGALPYMTEMIGYNGPIYMTYPTKAITPELLEDYRKIQVDIKKETNFFTSQMIADCMKKVVAVNLHETVEVDKDLRIKAYYAGHVLGAAMFEIRVGSESVVYTGDYNMTPDRHLGAAEIDRCEPDLLISESTYATTIRDSKRARERDFLKKVHDCVDRGGKVLIPTFALGRAQELCILLESYWERMNLQVPIYFTMGLTRKATDYYKLFISWTNEKIKKTFVQRNMFDFKHIKAFDKSYADSPEPMVLFATPGMLHSGTSLQVFKKWAPDERNMVIMPGYCVAGTIGHKIINGARKLELDGNRTLDIKLAVEYMSFSAHADAKGIMQLIRNCKPKHVMFVHGEDAKMDFLKQKVEKEFNVPVFKPANGETISVPTQPDIVVDVSDELVKRCAADDPLPSKRRCPFHGALLLDEKQQNLIIVSPDEAMNELKVKPHVVKFTTNLKPKSTKMESVETVFQRVCQVLEKNFKDDELDIIDSNVAVVGGCVVKVSATSTGQPKHLPPLPIEQLLPTVSVSWELKDDNTANIVLNLFKDLFV